MKKDNNPNQPIIFSEDGCIRFKKNKIVNHLLEYATEHGFSLNDICCQYDVHLDGKDNNDYVQLMQLIGYSTSGYGDLSTIPPREVVRADRIAEKLHKKRD